MPFTVDDFHDLVRLLEQRPEWRAELRRLVLTDELLQLPEIVRELAEAQQRTEQRLEALVQRVDALAEAQQRTEERLSDVGDRLGRLVGDVLELRYERHASSYFAPLARRIRVVSQEELQDLLERGLSDGSLSADEYRDILQADLVIRGRQWQGDDEIYLAVEVSRGVGVDDVVRAATRAGLLARLGITVVPVVAGDWITPDAAEPARAYRVWQVTDGRTVSPDAPQASP